MSRISFKVTGAQGQGINSVGEMVAKGLKRAGHHVFGYREYNSVIKGGHSSYQLDICDCHIESSETKVDMLVCLNYIGLKRDLGSIKKDGVLLHLIPDWKFSAEDQKLLDDNNVNVLYLPMEKILKEHGSRPIVGNMCVTAVVWGLLGRNYDTLKDMAAEQFAHKGEKVIKLNHDFIDEGKKFKEESASEVVIDVPAADSSRTDDLLVTGSEAMGMGMVHAGCRMYCGYPMTPSSPLLKYIADNQNETKMVVKQAEDEITAMQMVSGAMWMGTRAATATSGGGYDLMSETLSLNGIIENPSVMVLAMRQGPSTGLPTWSGQGDMLLSIFGSHGEYPRLVMSVSDAQDSFDLMPEAFNYAEEYQLPVTILTDKHIAEGLYMQPQYDLKKAKIRRGNLVTDQKELDKLVSADRYNPSAKDGVSPRWLPGSKAVTYCAQGDEHDGEGNVEEGGENAVQQMDKRMKKVEAMKAALPDPELFGDENAETLIVSWGSNKGCILDAIKNQKGIAYLHYSYLWPLKTEKLEALAAKAKKTIFVEASYQGHLAKLIKMETGLSFDHQILKYDGRPFFFDELLPQLVS
ncbi:MAG: 2-oxoacid:acceptor oxidoreductase subunit alpha [Candidatus Peribacter sp.]|jgi:2-oxoglutarate/2-oxoacid ferredoxin oxidoreductase subunit alpha|nr:2-oxoacid:acceptor oxidoreductase subunit alpha [Candidatus Peribacter sp.]MBT4393280.1 2-oxoacid:acceptor oxidoreductase subunit alpha [Candidatus Peribacter sp.]MBT4601175.1 2-oxoacid:acceptor oxidoreductase subunit alpha [Candidatus Peribacter sp.]MBT5148865.1 2-oxoacid:acceptor oxidoreductase subunit alpha [Candidatus Peribacter sp.]MBT5637255.1 2-oxoacid:acceptor oxidoreductase subunit alpha [Candidatus Peribacter sp.]